MRILFVRHGQTDWNNKKMVQGSNDIPLNSDGIEQANITKENLKGENIDVIFSSPLIRAYKTAQIINSDRNIEIIKDNRITERNFGVLEGKAMSGDDFRQCWNYRLNTKFEGSECVHDFFDRVHCFLDYLNQNYKDKTILIVSHGGVSLAVDSYFNGIVPGDGIPLIFMKNCEVRKYEKDCR